jgi:hypothetical protein
MFNGGLVTLVEAPGDGLTIIPTTVAAEQIPGTIPPDFSSGAVNIGDGDNDPTQQIIDTLVLVYADPGALAIFRRPTSDMTQPKDLSNLPITIKISADPTGQIATYATPNGGNGFVPGDTFTIPGPEPGDDPQGVVDTVDGGGAILTSHLTHIGAAGGFNTDIDRAIVATSGVGVDAIADLLTITPADYTARVTTLYYLHKAGEGFI